LLLNYLIDSISTRLSLVYCSTIYFEEQQLSQQALTNPLPGARGLPENKAGQSTFQISCPPDSFEYPILVAWRLYQSHWQRIYNLSTRFQYTVAIYTPRLPLIIKTTVSTFQES